MNKQLKERRSIIRKSFKEIDQKIFFARYKDIEKEEDFMPFFEEAVGHRTEGLMCKTLNENAEYIPDKRTDTWYKYKKDYINGAGDTVDLIPIGAWLGEGKRSGVYGAFLLASYNEKTNKFETVTKVGTGFSDEMLKTLYDTLKEYEIPDSKRNSNIEFGTNKPDNKPDVWFTPIQVWEIKGADLSLSLDYKCALNYVKQEHRGVCLRFPRFLRIRDDKKPEEGTSSKQIYEMYKDQPSVRENTQGYKMKVEKNENKMEDDVDDESDDEMSEEKIIDEN